MSNDILSLSRQTLLNKIGENNRQGIQANNRVLILYDFLGHYIGDTVCRICYLKAVRLFLKETAFIEINCRNVVVAQLLINNPYVNNISQTDTSQIDLREYGMVLITCVEKENEFIKLLEDQYQAAIMNDSFPIRVFSLSRVFDKLWQREGIFPVFPELIDFVRDHYSTVRKEIFLSDGERAWANSWLSSKGISEEDRLIIMMDDSTKKDKLLRMDVYFDVILYLLGKTRTRILIYDERQLGKRDFYKEWVGPEAIDRFVFAEGLSLRQGIALLGADAVSMIIGPCTGLLHCAAGIYATYMDNGLPAEKVPSMISFVGKELNDPSHKWDWWGNCLVNCVLVRNNRFGQRELLLLDQYCNDYLTCRNFTAELIIEFLEKKFHHRLKSIDR